MEAIRTFAAVKDFEAVELSPDHVKTIYNKALRLDKMGRKDEARAAFDEAANLESPVQEEVVVMGLTVLD